MNRTIKLVATLLLTTFASGSYAAPEVRKNLRATEFASQSRDLSQSNGDSVTVIEFRKGDRLAIHLQLEGDLIETIDPAPSYVTVKRSFWVTLHAHTIEISLDGTHFKPLNQVVDKSLSLSPQEDISGIAEAMNVTLRTILKP